MKPGKHVVEAIDGSLADPETFQRRVAAVYAPHVDALNRYVDALTSPSRPYPYFDPSDGGAEARLLILLERPARHAMRPRFVSRDNPGPAQRNLKRFLQEAQVPREATVLWNLIPWLPDDDVPSRTASAADIRQGCASLPAVLDRLTALRAVVFAGRVAASASDIVRERYPHLSRFAMPHPSPLSINQHPGVAERIVTTLREAYAYASRH